MSAGGQSRRFSLFLFSSALPAKPDVNVFGYSFVSSLAGDPGEAWNEPTALPVYGYCYSYSYGYGTGYRIHSSNHKRSENLYAKSIRSENYAY